MTRETTDDTFHRNFIMIFIRRSYFKIAKGLAQNSHYDWCSKNAKKTQVIKTKFLNL